MGVSSVRARVPSAHGAVNVHLRRTSRRVAAFPPAVLA